MNVCEFTLAGARLALLPSGALWWRAAGVLCVSDLHLGKSERIARRGGTMLPPYETADTLARLAADIAATEPRIVVSLGDAFDDDAAGAALAAADAERLAALATGRRWVWVAGNHDPDCAGIGDATDSLTCDGLTFRHVAEPGAAGEVSGHYHPKARIAARGARLSRPCLLHDAARAILPAYGTYTGGLDWTAPVLRELMGPDARAILRGDPPLAVPVPVPRPGAGRAGARRAFAGR